MIERTAWKVREIGELERRESYLSCVGGEGCLDGDCFGEGRFGGVSFERGVVLEEDIYELLSVVRGKILMRILEVLFQSCGWVQSFFMVQLSFFPLVFLL